MGGGGGSARSRKDNGCRFDGVCRVQSVALPPPIQHQASSVFKPYLKSIHISPCLLATASQVQVLIQIDWTIFCFYSALLQSLITWQLLCVENVNKVRVTFELRLFRVFPLHLGEAWTLYRGTALTWPTFPMCIAHTGLLSVPHMPQVLPQLRASYMAFPLLALALHPGNF